MSAVTSDMGKHYSAYCFAWSAIRPLYGLSELAGCMNPKSVMEVIPLPHVALVVSKQHHCVTETLPVLLPARGRGRRNIGFAQGWPQPKCVLVTVAVMNTPREKRHTVHPETIQRWSFTCFRPANKTDHLCQSWQYCHMFMKFRQSIT